MRITIIAIILFCFCVNSARTQNLYGTTGLLQMPTAEMQKDKTFMCGGGVLNPEIMPSKEWWGNYYTFNYYVNITIFPWLEIGYNCVLVKAKPNIYHWVPSTYGRFVHQDRSFHGRLRVWKEGWWRVWTPQVVVGANDPTTGSWEGGSSSDDQRYNGFFCRYYVVATKHVEFTNGSWGVHVAYVFNKKEVNHLNGPAIGTNYRFSLPRTSFINKVLNGVNLIIEYDSKQVNIGGCYSLWKDHINIYGELYKCKHPSLGLNFKIGLK